MTKNYRHTQHAGPGWWFSVAVLVALALGVEAWFNGVVLMLVAAVLIALIAGPVFVVLSRLTVEVDDSALRAFFGRGWPHKTLPLAEARSAQAVRNYWWYGFGIWWIPRGTVWTVWSFDAVEVGLSSGRRFRIGTDEPEALLAALESRLMAS
jgi:hypothetical protein